MRTEHGLPAVRGDARLARGARNHSRTMARRRLFGHGNWVARVSRSAGTRNIGEILGYEAKTSPRQEAMSMVRAWMHSPPHRAVILSRTYDRAGVGRTWARWGTRTVIYTVDFAAG